jgi:hypothetical protein
MTSKMSQSFSAWRTNAPAEGRAWHAPPTPKVGKGVKPEASATAQGGGSKNKEKKKKAGGSNQPLAGAPTAAVAAAATDES